MTGFRLGKHQPLTTQQHEEAVTPWNEAASEHSDEHQPQLITADAGILLTDFLDGFDDLSLMILLFLKVSLRLVEGLTTMAKQPDYKCDGKTTLEDQFHCYLAPDFFLIEMSK